MLSDKVGTSQKSIAAEQGSDPYRWFIMVLGALTNGFVIAVPTLALTVLMPEISKQLDLSIFQAGLIWGLSAITMIIGSLVAGDLTKKYGPKRMMVVNSILMGLAGASRGLAGDFNFLFLSVLIFSFFGPLIALGSFMNSVLWFSPKERGLSNGFATLGMAVGFFIGSFLSASVLSPLLNGWQNVFYLYGMIGILFGVIWMTTRRNPNERSLQAPPAEAGARQLSMLDMLRMPLIWALGLGILGNAGSIQGVLGYLPLYFDGLGMDVMKAGMLVSSFHIFSMIFVLPLSFIAGKYVSREVALIVTSLFTTIGFVLLFTLNVDLILIAIILSGMVRDGLGAILFTKLSDIKEIGIANSSVATALMLIFLNFGNLIAPPIGNSLAGVGTEKLPLMFWAGLAAFGSLSMIFFYWMETRSNAKEQKKSMVCECEA